MNGEEEGRREEEEGGTGGGGKKRIGERERGRDGPERWSLTMDRRG